MKEDKEQLKNKKKEKLAEILKQNINRRKESKTKVEN
jgi:hypothetical protein